MAVTSRQRKVPPAMFSDELLLELPRDVRLTGIGLRFFANDYGRETANTRLIKSQLFPLDDDITEDTIDESLLVLEEVGYIRLYTVDRRTYFELVDWPPEDTRNSGPSRVPQNPDTSDSSTQTPVGITRGSREALGVVEGGKEGEEGRGGGGRQVSGGGAAGRARALLVDTPEPSPFCSKHPIGTEEKCGPCGGARKRHEAWVQAQVTENADELGGAA